MTASPSSPSSPPASPRPDPLDLARPALEANADMAAARDADIALVLRGVRVRIQKRPPAPDAPATEEQFETAELKELRLPLDPTLDDIRAALVGCELGDPGRDIFFPAWTKSLYIAWRAPDASADDAPPPAGAAGKAPEAPAAHDGDDNADGNADGNADDDDGTAAVVAAAAAGEEVETVETDSALRVALAREEASPGSLTLLLQECRNARYSRRKRAPARMLARAMYAPMGPLFAPSPRADRPIYFDRPLPYALHPAYACMPPGAQFPPEFYIAPPYMPMVPFVYAPPHGAQQ